jgi:hypothetical protein
MTKRKKNGTCVLCGFCGEITRDHAPPKVVFPAPRPSNCITVPSCKECNSGMSDLDEDFGNFMALLAAQDSPEGKKIWEDRLSGIKRNTRNFNEIIANLRSHPILDCDGLITGVQHLIPFTPNKFVPIYDKCFRALYFQKYNKIYPIELEFEYFYPRDLTGQNEELLGYLFTRNIGANHVFYCGVARAEESEDAFVGLLLFYERLAVVGITTNLKKLLPRSNGEG